MRREEVPKEVACEKANNHVDNAGQHQDPCGLKVQVAAPAILVGHHVAVAGGNTAPGRGDGQSEQGLSSHIADLAPIETRVRNNNFGTGNEECEETHDRDPMRHADDCTMPGNY